MKTPTKGFEEIIKIDGKQIKNVRIELYKHRKLFKKYETHSECYNTNGCDMEIVVRAVKKDTP